MSELSLSGLEPHKLARLLNVALGDSVPAGDEEGPASLEGWLREMLAWPVLAGGGAIHRPAGPSGQGARTVGDLLVDPAADVDVIEAVKRRAKSRATRGGAEGEAAKALYFAAIAGGLVHHDAKISKHPYDLLAEAFASLSGKPWVPAPIRNLYAAAAPICRQRASA